jgi:hypothetical protein
MGWEGVDWTHLAVGTCEHCNEPLGSIKGIFLTS